MNFKQSVQTIFIILMRTCHEKHLKFAACHGFCPFFQAHIHLLTSIISMNMRCNTVFGTQWFCLLNKYAVLKAENVYFLQLTFEKTGIAGIKYTLSIEKSLKIFLSLAMICEFLVNWHCHIFVIMIQFVMQICSSGSEKLVEHFSIAGNW